MCAVINLALSALQIGAGLSLTGSTLSVNAADSITFSSPGGAGSAIQLVGDSASPSASSYYGTNGAGTRGWYLLSSGDVTSIAGTANQIVASASTGAVTLSLATNLILPGNSITFASGNLHSNTFGTTNNLFLNSATFAYNNAGNSNNVFIGMGVGANQAGSNGGDSVGVGNGALYHNTTGVDQTAIGLEALTSNTTSGYNTAVGNFALNGQTDSGGSDGLNCAFGAASLIVFNGTNTVGIGRYVGRFLTSGADNVLIGTAAVNGTSQTSLTSTTVVGSQCGQNFTGNFITLLGYGTDTTVGAAASTNSTALGNGAKITASNQVSIGNSSVTSLVLAGTAWGAPNALTFAGGSSLTDSSGALTIAAASGATHVFGLPTQRQHQFTTVNTSLASWTTTGAGGVFGSGSTYTNSSTAGSGTAASAVFWSFATPTLAATNTSVTTTDAATLFISGAPTAGTNQTITNNYSLWAQGTVRIGTNALAMEFNNDSGSSTRILSFNRGSSAYIAANYDALTHTFKVSGSTALALSGVLSTGAATVSYSTAASSTSTGAFIVNNVFSVGGTTGNVFAGGVITSTNSTASSSTTTGAFQVAGGVGIGGAGYFGGNLNVTSAAGLNGGLSVSVTQANHASVWLRASDVANVDWQWYRNTSNSLVWEFNGTPQMTVTSGGNATLAGTLTVSGTGTSTHAGQTQWSTSIGAQGLGFGSATFGASATAGNTVAGIAIGQDSTHAGALYWTYNATAGNAVLALNTASYTNPIAIDASTITFMGQHTTGTMVFSGTTTTTFAGAITSTVAGSSNAQTQGLAYANSNATNGGAFNLVKGYYNETAIAFGANRSGAAVILQNLDTTAANYSMIAGWNATGFQSAAIAFTNDTQGGSGVAEGSLHLMVRSAAAGLFSALDISKAGVATFTATTSGTSTTLAAVLMKSAGLTENLWVGGTGNFAGTLTAQGNLVVTGNIVNASDLSLKTEVTPISSGLDLILKLRPVTYQFRSSPGPVHMGLIAQEVAGVASAGYSLVNREGTSMGLSYTQLIAPLIRGEQELHAEILSLKARVAELEGLTT